MTYATDLSSKSPVPKSANNLDLAELTAIVRDIDQAQDAHLEATNLLRDEVGALHGLLAHLVQILTPAQPEDDGPSLRELLARVIQQQNEMTRLLVENLKAAATLETLITGSASASVPTKA